MHDGLQVVVNCLNWDDVSNRLMDTLQENMHELPMELTEHIY